MPFCVGSRRALAECQIEGLATNIALLRLLAADADVAGHAVHTRWLEASWARLYPASPNTPRGQKPLRCLRMPRHLLRMTCRPLG